ncbi:MAG: hypothetical protein JWO94_3334 [Verrucomicrobiaceae bacterium]|nr:hypothetical protein [Verrucomicrobiaceae bacterium]
MRIQFLNDGSEFRTYGGGSFSKTKGTGGLFWWTLAIFLLLALATTSWFFSIWVFAHPEKPFSYKLLSKMQKLEPIRRWSVHTVPNGPLLTTNKLLEQYFYYTGEQMRVANDVMKRSYIKNFKEHSPEYVFGNFKVLAARPLSASDVFTEGWVVVARSNEIEDVDVELLLPGLKSEVPPYKEGDALTLEKKKAFASVVHVQRLDGERIQATLVSLLYQNAPGKEAEDAPAADSDSELATLAPPAQLNMEAVWPVSHDLKIAGPAAAEAPAKTREVAAREP